MDEKDKEIIKALVENPELYPEINEMIKENILNIKNINKIAKAITHFAFRNGPVEDMHANGKLTESDMKILNKFMVNRLAYIFSLIIKEEWIKFNFLVNMTDNFYGRHWDPAEPDDGGTEEIIKKLLNQDKE